MISDPNLTAAAGIAVEGQNNLLIGGYDARGQARIDTFNTGPEIDLVRSVIGARTGLLPGRPSPFNRPTMSIAVIQATSEHFVSTAPPAGSSTPIRVSAFPANAGDDVSPQRVISGSSTGVAGTASWVPSKIAVADDVRLFVAQPNNTILVFAAGAGGDVAPTSRIIDSTLGTATLDQGGIAVR